VLVLCSLLHAFEMSSLGMRLLLFAKMMKDLKVIPKDYAELIIKGEVM
jgi:GNAT superfamily N-acetyltransferase